MTRQKTIVPPEAAVTFSNGTMVVPSALRYGQRHKPMIYAWLLQAIRKDGSLYQDFGFSVSEKNAEWALRAAWRTAQNLLVTFEEVRKV